MRWRRRKALRSEKSSGRDSPPRAATRESRPAVATRDGNRGGHDGQDQADDQLQRECHARNGEAGRAEVQQFGGEVGVGAANERRKRDRDGTRNRPQQERHREVHAGDLAR
jgi:hypothetical protein